VHAVSIRRVAAPALPSAASAVCRRRCAPIGGRAAQRDGIDYRADCAAQSRGRQIAVWFGGPSRGRIRRRERVWRRRMRGAISRRKTPEARLRRQRTRLRSPAAAPDVAARKLTAAPRGPIARPRIGRRRSRPPGRPRGRESCGSAGAFRFVACQPRAPPGAESAFDVGEARPPCLRLTSPSRVPGPIARPRGGARWTCRRRGAGVPWCGGAEEGAPEEPSGSRLFFGDMIFAARRGPALARALILAVNRSAAWRQPFEIEPVAVRGRSR